MSNLLSREYMYKHHRNKLPPKCSQCNDGERIKNYRKALRQIVEHCLPDPYDDRDLAPGFYAISDIARKVLKENSDD